MYIDKQGKEHPYIHLLMEDTNSYLKGWYFEDETNCFYNEPFDTLEEAEKQLADYFAYLNRSKN
jgi:hypothetical protein